MPRGRVNRFAHIATTLFLLALLANFIRAVYINDRAHDGWVMGDWVINYSAGFTRRGAWGQGLLALSTITGLPLWVGTLLSQIGLRAILVAAFLLLIRRKLLPFWFLALVWSPLTFLFATNDSYAAGRKDVLILAALAVYVLLLRDSRAAASRLFAIAAGAGSVFVTLTHEAFFFYLPYFWAAGQMMAADARHARAGTLAITAGAAASMTAILGFGRAIPAAELCNALVARGLPTNICGGAISAATLLNQFEPMYLRGRVTFHTLAMLLACLPVIAGLLACRAHARLRTAGLFAAAALAFSAPLFLFAIDWGRFLSLHMMALMILATAWLPDADAAVQQTRVSTWRVGGASAAILVCSLTWGIPHCCYERFIPGAGLRAIGIVAVLARGGSPAE